MTAETLAQVVVSGLLTGMIYALIAAGLSLIFGLMDVVNFAHGEFLMTAMYATFVLYITLSIDPLFLLPMVAVFLFAIGVVVYRVLIVRALSVKVNSGMVQIFATFGLGIFLRGIAQFVFSPDFKSLRGTMLSDKTVSVLGVFMPLPQLAASLVCVVAFIGLWLLTTKTHFGRALEATREDSEAVALIGVDRHFIFAMGWGIGAATVGVAGVMLSTFYYISPGVGVTFALIAYVVVALGGFGSLPGALVAGLAIGLVEALTTLLIPPSLKQVGVFGLYLLVLFVRPRGLFGNL
ncbi:MAG TPA: branched-chain amino acid ABC transporter permease [Stellaceae bacterium]|nr:branched-chain amino acid ABC transporter permease [Stellaceae bacterium]